MLFYLLDLKSLTNQLTSLFVKRFKNSFAIVVSSLFALVNDQVKEAENSCRKVMFDGPESWLYSDDVLKYSCFINRRTSSCCIP